jgi:hypothetical protein
LIVRIKVICTACSTIIRLTSVVFTPWRWIVARIDVAVNVLYSRRTIGSLNGNIDSGGLTIDTAKEGNDYKKK